MEKKNQNNINLLIQKLIDEKISDPIDIDNISNLFSIIENNKPIPIEYYTKILTDISNNNKKCNIKMCEKKALYIDENKKCYCWIHCQLN